MMLTAPRGVTKMAGAYAYAAKFATSPVITEKIHYTIIVAINIANIACFQ